ncbi:MAG: hypothetical protein L0Y71_19350 [Gemmataceae bacterium]|nr:hypothetical protein [Gemmataceae bacterium]
MEVRTQIEVARRLAYLRSTEVLVDHGNQVGRLLNRLITNH